MNRYRTRRRPGVPFLQPEEIEWGASRLLGAYAERFGVALAPPIPVDEILESHLHLDLRFKDLPRELGKPNVLGATWVRRREVAVDESLDPTLNPKMEGRYRFTLGHEVGHWQLHRHLYPGLDQGVLFPGLAQEEEPFVICRAGDFDSKEWQANQFAAYLLMPWEMVVQAWQELRGDLEPYCAQDEILDLCERWHLGDDQTPTVRVAREMARVFNVSGQAMQIRLRGMGLIYIDERPTLVFRGDRAT